MKTTKKYLAFLLSIAFVLMLTAFHNMPCAIGSLKQMELASIENPDSLIPYQTFKVDAPIQHGNLQIFPITGRYGITTKKFVTLTEAMEKGYVKVNETGTVSQLTMENLSDHHIFIQSGDIVKGGRQDRTMQYDVLVLPKEKSVPLASFCVESGRWSQRTGESATNFNSSKYNVASRDLKISAKKDGNQGQVWQKVSEQQGKLVKNISTIKDTTIQINTVSPTSMQLTLEHTDLEEIRAKYKAAFGSVLQRSDIVGFAYAINGEVYGLDVYNNAVFQGLKEKMLDGFITEAIGDMDTTKTKMANTDDVQKLLSNVNMQGAAITSKPVNKQTKFDAFSIGKENRFITTDVQAKQWLHLNVINASEKSTEVEPNGTMNFRINSYQMIRN